MSRFTFTSPEGRSYDVEGPEGTTKEQAFAILQQSLRSRGKSSSPRPVNEPTRAPNARKVGKSGAAPAESLARGNIGSAIIEPLLSMGTAALAKPASEVMGMSAAAFGDPKVAEPRVGATPLGFQQAVQRALTYEPRTQYGRSPYNPLNAIPKYLGAAVDKVATGAEHMIAPPPTSGPGMAAAGYAAKGLIEQLPNIAGAFLGRGAAARTAAKQEALDVAKGENAVKDATRDAAQAAGYRTPPEHGIKAAASGLVGKTKAEKILSEQNELNATRRLGAEVGVPDGAALSEAEFDRLKADAGRFYDEVPKALGPSVTVTPQFDQALRGTLDRIESLTDQVGLAAPKRVIRSFLRQIAPPGAATPGAGGPPIMRTITQAAQEQPALPIAQTLEQAASDAPHHFGIQEPPNMPISTPAHATLSTERVMSDIQQLRKQAKADFARKDNELGTTRLGIANQLENLVEQNLSRTGQQGLLEAYRVARERFAKIYMLERVTNDATGRVNLQKLASLSDTPAYKGVLTGEFKTAADFAKAYRKAAQRSTGEAIPRLSVLDGLFVAYGVAGALFGHPSALLAPAAEMGGRLAIPYAAEKGLLQNRTPSYIARPPLTRFAPPLGLLTTGQENQIAAPPF